MNNIFIVYSDLNTYSLLSKALSLYRASKTIRVEVNTYSVRHFPSLELAKPSGLSVGSKKISVLFNSFVIRPSVPYLHNSREHVAIREKKSNPYFV